MTWLAAIVRGIVEALLAAIGRPRKTRLLGGDESMAEGVRDRIRLRRRQNQEETYGGSAARRRDGQA